MPAPRFVAALDFGATSGRVIGGAVTPSAVELRTFARFRNRPVRLGDRLHWDLPSLWQSALDGLADVARAAETAGGALASVAADTWGVDYGLLRGGRILSNPVHYREARTADAVAAVDARISPAAQYAVTGIQSMPINTVYQLAADACVIDAADTAVLMPDLFGWLLSGEIAAERTIASTTGLLDAASGDWSNRLLDACGVRRGFLPDLVAPGARLGALRESVAADIGVERPPAVIAVGSHDTASAVVGTPLGSPASAFLSCGTWGLVGLERREPLLTEEARQAGFTNERGVDGRFLFMRNAMGLWLLTQAAREWPQLSLSDLLEGAAQLPGDGPLFDVDDPRFQAPGSMSARVGQWLRERDLDPPQGPFENVRCILESLAAAFANAIEVAGRLASVSVDTVHIVGGGSRNALLCQAVADRTGLAVLAGPSEATALGNLLVQARTIGVMDGDLTDLRALVSRTHRPVPYSPRKAR